MAEEPTLGEAYDRKLERVIAKRMKAGEAPENLTAQLRTRLDPARAQVIVANAAWRLAAPRNNGRAPAILVHAWACVLALQNLGILVGAREALTAGSTAFVDRNMAVIALPAVAQVVLLLTGLIARVWTRNRYLTALYAALILYACPIQGYIFGLLTRLPSQPGVSPLQLIQFNAAISYASVAALAALWRLNHRRHVGAKLSPDEPT
jgi:hypothetical protein